MDDHGPYYRVRLNYTNEVIADVQERHNGLRLAPRAVENALRRGELRFYQFGQKRYTTPKLIDEWLQLCRSGRFVTAE
ncbi:hypothetical protein [Mycobacterium kiyosense]|uniref:Uncharacterized protein n=1 Tax=Mycobacterium kiyosense TaxID=2871094 RepID=A0A9P3Q9R6_9MYCO|nr:hypothetical protein [Mycobacterium kiyosense]GLB83494.1 hypothetical protein SRL2020028_27500 [Mycobacterium kiyosense]GLB94311.1 hypothetical protein SRL2020226_10870 [Mycobacterium kiyosense]GLD32644.1 hypothetical protein Mkiyose1413_45270 [Mycobacterium kiyosense]GLD37219.1 hypothetical protein Mkiyose1595_34390 [Mycobacterium kiyosense]